MTPEEEKALTMIADAAKILGWDVSFEDKSDEKLTYIILGEKAAVEKVIGAIEFVADL